MRKYLVLLCGCVLAAGLPARAVPQAGAPGQPPAFAGSAPPEELQVLAPLVGQWTSRSVVRPSLQAKEGFTVTGEITGQWFHNRHFLSLESRTTSAQHREEVTVVYGYDARQKVYRRWLFSSTGLATESQGHWDAAKKTMTWKPLNLPPDVTGSVTDVFAKDRVETTVYFKRGDGQVLADFTVTATRKQAGQTDKTPTRQPSDKP